ncbi:MAG: hypothetical protein EP330_22395 [Deltaproteobacteria bacterium]|nr:MAG: hypothetical protein EP330_22395 [Deltaproteobacteria bacterium]
MTRVFTSLALLGFATTVSAKEVAGRVGVGADAAISGAAAIHTTYWVSQKVGLQGSLGMAMTSPDGGGGTTVAILGVAGLYNLVERDTVNLTGQLAFGLAAVDASVFRISPSLRPELFVTDDLSLHTTVGVSLIFGDGSGVLGSNVDGTTFRIGTSGLVGGAGFTFYF